MIKGKRREDEMSNRSSGGVLTNGYEIIMCSPDRDDTLGVSSDHSASFITETNGRNTGLVHHFVFPLQSIIFVPQGEYTYNNIYIYIYVGISLRLCLNIK